jgi:ribonucleoside-diphosphate reductase alpha chain
VIGKGEEESRLGEAPGAGAPATSPAAQIVSRGLVRGKQDRLMLIHGGGGFSTDGATALKGEFAPMRELETGLLDLPFAPPPPSAAARPSAAEKRTEALMKGYQGDACGECGNFTLVRNGTCLKCDTCGSTTGCS